MANIVRGDGPIPCDGMIVGEAPGEQEELLGKPFVGPSGELLDEALVAAGLAREDVYVTNVYKLRPPNNDTPTDEQIESHLNMLMDEVNAVSPNVIMPLGNTALHTFRPDAPGISRVRGKVGRIGPSLIVPTYHPSFVLRIRGSAQDDFFSDVKLFVELMNGE